MPHGGPGRWLLGLGSELWRERHQFSPQRVKGEPFSERQRQTFCHEVLLASLACSQERLAKVAAEYPQTPNRQASSRRRMRRGLWSALTGLYGGFDLRLFESRPCATERFFEASINANHQHVCTAWGYASLVSNLVLESSPVRF